LEDTL